MLQIYKKYFAFAGSHVNELKKSVIFGFLSSMFEALQIMALLIIVTALVEQNHNKNIALIALVVMIISIAGVIITSNMSKRKQQNSGLWMCVDKRMEIGNKMRYMPMGFFTKNNLGMLTSVLTNAMEDMQNVGVRIITITMEAIIHILVLTVFLLFIDIRIGAITIAGLLMFFIVNILMQKKADRISDARAMAQINLVSAVLEYVQGMGVVKSFNLLNKANKKIDTAIEECEKQNFGLETAFIPFMAMQTLVLRLTGIAIIAASLLFYIGGTMTLDYAIILIVVTFMMFAKLEQAGAMSALMRLIEATMNKIKTVDDSPEMDIEGKAIQPKFYDIKGENITFSYRDKVIFDNVSFNIPHKTTTAVVGPSGGGKTTLCNLIARFWDVDSGSISLDGVDIREYKMDSLLSNISMVFQDVYLFNDTIANNIKFGKPNADMGEVIKAAKKACCHDFISSLPNGYDTIIGEGGATISGGEKQRISIARAILKDAPIIILDEATANVDPENENLLGVAIEELTHDKTIIMIAHRLKTVRNADQILVIENGKIVQTGTHDELLKQDGIYRKFIDIRKQAIGWKLSS